jgi:hypothetical protein
VAGAQASKVVFEHSIGPNDTQTGSKTSSILNARQAYVVASGIGSLNVTFSSNGQAIQDKAECYFYLDGTPGRFCMLWSKSDLQYDSKEMINIKVDYHRGEYNANDTFKFMIYTGDFVETSATYRTFLDLNGIESVNLLMDYKDVDPKILKAEGAKIQYASLLPYSNSIELAHSLTMYLRKGETRATPSNSAVQVGSKLGLGLIKTLVSSDADFCSDTRCKVAIRLDAVNLDYIDFFVILKNKTTENAVAEGTTYLEELLEDDQVTYVYDINDFNKETNWKFDLTPITGNPDMSVNIGSKPDSLTAYRWKTTEDKPEEIFITREELQSLKLDGQKVYVTFNSSTTTQFSFRVSTSLSMNSHLRPNLPVSGEAKDREIINYIYEAYTSYPETISVYADLTAKSGNPDLYIKDCSNVKTEEQCVITQADIDSWRNIAESTERFALKSSNTKGDDRIFLRFNCLPYSNQFQNFTFQGDEKDLFTTKFCIFAVAVVGKKTSTHKTSKYTLQLKGSNYHEIGQVGTALYLNEGPQNKIFIKYDIDNIDTKHNYLNFKFTITSGDFEVYLSRLTPYPDESNADKVEKISTVVGQKKSEFDHYVTIKADPKILKGTHYLTIKVRSANQAIFLRCWKRHCLHFDQRC